MSYLVSGAVVARAALAVHEPVECFGSSGYGLPTSGHDDALVESSARGLVVGLARSRISEVPCLSLRWRIHNLTASGMQALAAVRAVAPRAKVMIRAASHGSALDEI